MKHFLIAAFAIALAVPAQAAVVLFDDFNSENGGVAANNYSGFANFGVTGRVDLVRNGQPKGFPLSGTLSGDGLFVDLSGTPGAVPLNQLFSDPFSLKGGERVTLSFLASGNQRLGSDILTAGFELLDGLQAGDLASNNLDAPGALLNLIVAGRTLNAADPWAARSISFTALSSGSFRIGVSAPNLVPLLDFYGPLVDNIQVDVVPAPAALSLFGLGLVALAARRRPR